MCEYCNAKIYIKTQKIMKSVLAPLTHTEELRQELEDITGEMYLEFPHNYCPQCRKEVVKMTLGTRMFRDNYISEDKLERYDRMCNIADERINRVIFGLEKEVIFYPNEIIDLELGFLNYMWNKLFLVSEMYGIALKMEEDKINNCYRVSILEEKNE